VLEPIATSRAQLWELPAGDELLEKYRDNGRIMEPETWLLLQRGGKLASGNLRAGFSGWTEKR
jgi:hypothetical protein